MNPYIVKVMQHGKSKDDRKKNSPASIIRPWEEIDPQDASSMLLDAIKMA